MTTTALLPPEVGVDTAVDVCFIIFVLKSTLGTQKSDAIQLTKQQSDKKTSRQNEKYIKIYDIIGFKYWPFYAKSVAIYSHNYYGCMHTCIPYLHN